MKFIIAVQSMWHGYSASGEKPTGVGWQRRLDYTLYDIIEKYHKRSTIESVKAWIKGTAIAGWEDDFDGSQVTAPVMPARDLDDPVTRAIFYSS